jgi:acetyl-CoA C-acetyltransferase
MPYVASIGTYLPCWGTPRARLVGVDRASARKVGMRGVGIGVDSTMHELKPHLSHVNVTEVHDFFTDIELISYEDHGFAERRGGYELVEMDVTTIGGAVPVNTGGGVDAQAAKKADGPRIGLAHNIGGATAVLAVTILEGTAHGAR